MQLLEYLLTEDERQKVKLKATEYIRGKSASPAWVLADWPDNDPDWDPNIPDGKLALSNFIEAVLEGLRPACNALVSIILIFVHD